MLDYDKFNKAIDIDGLLKDVKDAENNAGNNDFENVPYGDYEVKIEKLTLTESKKGLPMLSAWFKIIEGEQKDRLLFMNQVITQGFQIHMANEFLRTLKTGATIEFKEFKQYGELIDGIFEAINSTGMEYAIQYGERKGYATFTIKEAFVPADNIPF